MKTSSYLYDVENLSTVLKDETYEQAILMKMIFAKRNLYQLVRVDDMKDSKRIYSVSKAYDFNRKLLKELELSDAEIKNKLKEWDKKNGKCI